MLINRIAEKILSLFFFVEEYKSYREYIDSHRKNGITIVIFFVFLLNVILLVFLGFSWIFGEVARSDIHYLIPIMLVLLLFASYFNKNNQIIAASNTVLLITVLFISFLDSIELVQDHNIYFLYLFPVIISGFVAPTLYPMIISVIITLFVILMHNGQTETGFIVMMIFTGSFLSIQSGKIRTIVKELVYEKQSTSCKGFISKTQIDIQKTARNKADAIRIFMSKIMESEKALWVLVILGNKPYWKHASLEYMDFKEKNKKTLLLKTQEVPLNKLCMFDPHHFSESVSDKFNPFLMSHMIIYKTFVSEENFSVYIGYKHNVSSLDIDVLSELIITFPSILEKFIYFEKTNRNFHEVKNAYNELLIVLSKVSDLRDNDTQGHAERTALMAYELAQSMGLKGDELRKVYEGALLHDIGKIGIPDSILLKKGSLTPKEREFIKTHPKLSMNILRNSDYLIQISEIPLYHHEKWDGTGYPFGLKENNIPLVARIFAIVDVWDALTSCRVYKEAMTAYEAAKIIISESGKHFDPKVVMAFIDYLENKRIIQPGLFKIKA